MGVTKMPMNNMDNWSIVKRWKLDNFI